MPDNTLPGGIGNPDVQPPTDNPLDDGGAAARQQSRGAQRRASRMQRGSTPTTTAVPGEAPGDTEASSAGNEPGTDRSAATPPERVPQRLPEGLEDGELRTVRAVVSAEGDPSADGSQKGRSPDDQRQRDDAAPPSDALDTAPSATKRRGSRTPRPSKKYARARANGTKPKAPTRDGKVRNAAKLMRRSGGRPTNRGRVQGTNVTPTTFTLPALQTFNSGLAEGRKGQGTLYRREYDETVRGLALLGCTNEEIAQAFDISETTLAKWQNDYPTFRTSLKGAKDFADAQVVNSLFARATGYSHMADKIFFREGDETPTYVPYVKHYPPETAAAIFWLKNRRKQDWRDRHELDVQQPLAALTPEQRLDAVVAIMAKARKVLEANTAQDEEATDAEYEEIEE